MKFDVPFRQKRIARKLFAVYGNVVSAVLLGFDSATPYRVKHNRHLPCEIIIVLVSDKGKIKVVFVVVNGAAPQ